MNRKEFDDYQKLNKWKKRLADNDSAYSKESAKMNKREKLYSGDRNIDPLTVNGKKEKTKHLRNICMEAIEGQVDSAIPMPKVSARRKEDEPLAALIEDLLRNEIDRMPFEIMNDMMARTVPIQGGGYWLVEWDNTKESHFTIGELAVSTLHPKMVVPQDGVFSSIEDMDYIILKVPQTEGYILRKYGVDVHDEAELEPDIKGGEEVSSADDLVTQYIAYYKNEDGGIGIFSWVKDKILEDIEDYQARHLRVCKECGATEPLSDGLVPIGPLDPLKMSRPDRQSGKEPTLELGPFGVETRLPKKEEYNKDGQKVCPYCGCTEWVDSNEDYEEIYNPIFKSDGTQIIPGMQVSEAPVDGAFDEFGNQVYETIHEPTKVPFYKPNIYPVILQKNVSMFGKLLGGSDLDAIEDQQNTINRLEQKIADKVFKSGSYLSLPDSCEIKYDEDEVKVIRPSSVADMQMIQPFYLQGDIEQDLIYLETIYQEHRQIIGLTDSYQGRTDKTATSGKAKEFSAAQAAGRLESKRVMKDAAFATLYEAMFKFILAYADEPRTVISKDEQGRPVYKQFNRYDFLEVDSAGEWYWNDQFLFSCDSASTLANNREAMWQETRANLQTGAFGDPANPETLIIFWQKMELLHYPGAGDTKKLLEDQLRRQRMQQMQMQQQQMQMQQAQMQAQQNAQNQQVMRNVINKAKADAEAAVKQQAGGNQNAGQENGKTATATF